MRKKNKKLLLVVPTMIALTLSTKAYAQTSSGEIPYLPSSTFHSVTIAKSEKFIAIPFADIKGWRYKSVDGKMYRRQYNYSRQKWIGKWELC